MHEASLDSLSLDEKYPSDASQKNNMLERVILNVGGKRFETYVSTLKSYPDTLLGAMFSDRNRDLRRPDSREEYFFDR